MENKIYCPYTDLLIDANNTSPEHIIPLSLGGINGFEIPVDKTFNKVVGSLIDGKLSNDFFIKFDRINNDIKGHSNKNPSYIAKNGKIDDNPENVRIKIDRLNGIEIWNPKESKIINNASKISFTGTTDIKEFRLIRLQFIAKAALSGGFFIYKDSFIKAVKHNDLRSIMNFNKSFDMDNINDLDIVCDVELSDTKNPYFHAFKYITSIIGKSSCIGFIPSKDNFAIFVGILGRYIGTIVVNSNSKLLPNENINECGTFVCIQNKKLVICSWKQMTKKASEHLIKLNSKKD